jgi:hypothetical protein
MHFERDRIQEATRAKDIITNFFTLSSTRITSYQAFRAISIAYMLEQVNLNNCETPEKTFATLNKMLGMKEMFDLLELQARMVEEYESR